jgi:hypothetical protein
MALQTGEASEERAKIWVIFLSSFIRWRKATLVRHGANQLKSGFSVFFLSKIGR